ncbi:MAG TPA: hypothetical protein P5038_01315 [Candidatus Paceibacterota bacterium]|nr:hypothetical protein [Candidatus Paceibacterota bacterium]HRT55242.1 hypothetical protein [Candidatus Paceibacterota bacterium]
MKTIRSMALSLGLIATLAVPNVSQAMSELVSMSMEPLWPETTTPGNVITYKITAVVREGQGLLEVNLSSAGLPAGTQVAFSPAKLRFTGRVPTVQTAIMTITCTKPTPTDIYPFTVTGTAQREAITITNQVVLSRSGALLPWLTLDLQSGGSLKIWGLGVGGQTYQIQSTGDLNNPVWTDLGLTTADGNGRFIFNLGNMNEAPMKFFRAVAVAPILAPLY